MCLYSGNHALQTGTQQYCFGAEIRKATLPFPFNFPYVTQSLLQVYVLSLWRAVSSQIQPNKSMRQKIIKARNSCQSGTDEPKLAGRSRQQRHIVTDRRNARDQANLSRKQKKKEITLNSMLISELIFGRRDRVLPHPRTTPEDKFSPKTINSETTLT
ncbi:jg24560 [Pararge aegeria aegeria]|uniref:Jg24560 protein n=1 Tax=Pararge aegeria aegeria TaxID=348720 RepID=A0A8S4QQY3_9NEOP|nr:jg24560 [Pararge aegeria aegeria]